MCLVSTAKTDQPIEMPKQPFGVWTLGPKEPCSGQGLDFLLARGTFWECLLGHFPACPLSVHSTLFARVQRCSSSIVTAHCRYRSSLFVCAAAFYEKAEITQDDKKPNHLIIAMTSDRGLCGSAHSNIVRAIKAAIPEKPPGTNLKIVAIGDKARGMLSR